MLHLKMREMQKMLLKNVKAVLFVDQKSMLNGQKAVADMIIVAVEMTDVMNAAGEDILQEIAVPGDRTDMMIEIGIIERGEEAVEVEALPEADLLVKGAVVIKIEIEIEREIEVHRLEGEANLLVIVTVVSEIEIERERAEHLKNEMEEKIEAAGKEVIALEIGVQREKETEVLAKKGIEVAHLRIKRIKRDREPDQKRETDLLDRLLKKGKKTILQETLQSRNQIRMKRLEMMMMSNQQRNKKLKTNKTFSKLIISHLSNCFELCPWP